ERIRLLVASHGDHRGELPRVALDRHVVSGGDEHCTAEIRAVGELVEDPRKRLLRRRETHVDHVEALLDGVAEAGEEDRAAPGEPGSEHTNAGDAAPGRERSHDSCTGGSVPAEVALRIVSGDYLFVLVERDGHSTLELAHERVVGLDSRVEDAHPNA